MSLCLIFFPHLMAPPMQKHQVTLLQALKNPSVPPTMEMRPAEEVFDKIPTNVATQQQQHTT